MSVILTALLEIILDALVDTLKIVPFLFLVYLLIEYTEHRHSEKLVSALQKLGPLGSLGGALLGSVPQCGFSAAASNLYAGRMISLGTLVAVFISTSDEAIPMLIANPKSAGVIWKLILIKILIATLVGVIADALLKLKKHKSDVEPDFEELCEGCDCEHHHIAVSALIHTVQISLFIFAVSLLLGIAMHFIGTKAVSEFMLSGSFFQPFVTALFGFIPNCASSVVITELYLQGVISFGSCISGLCTGAGVGLLVLFRSNRHHMKQNFAIMGIMYAAAVISGIIINII